MTVKITVLYTSNSPTNSATRPIICRLVSKAWLSERCSAKMDDTNSSVRQLFERVAEKTKRCTIRFSEDGVRADEACKKTCGTC